MDPITQAFIQGAAGASGDKTYVDDVFSTYVYRGNNTARSINNGIDLAGEGGLVWTKIRSTSWWGPMVDTARGKDYTLTSSSNTGQGQYATTSGNEGITSFHSNGYSLGADGSTGVFNYSTSQTYASWTFRKAPGFFDIVTWTGDGVDGRDIPHNLESVPGCIMIKRTSANEDWAVYHRSIGNTEGLTLNNTGYNSYSKTWWDETTPNATTFRIDNAARVNTVNQTYVAYVFAGGASTAATARSVDLDGSGDYLSIAASTDLNLDGAFTIEAWVNVDDHGWSGTRRTLLANSTGWTTNHAAVSLMNSANSNEENTIILYNNTSTIADSSPVRIEPKDGWTHIAITRDSSNDIRIFKNGTKAGSTTNYSGEFKFGTGTTWIGAITMSTGSTPEVMDGRVSNLRVVKGTAVYTSSFRPPTEPLTNITNTKLLCCNNSSTTGSTVTPGTITANGNPTASIDSPFDDPEGFKFGKGGDQNLIKTGSYIGNGSSAGPEINLGWEPQYLLIKNASASQSWWCLDNMRGITTGGSDSFFTINSPDGNGNATRVSLTPTGFKMLSGSADLNGSGNTIVYIAIRRPDGYVGKPVETATSVFAMDTGNSSSTIPCFDSGFPVDFSLLRQPSSVQSWYTGARLTGPYHLFLNTHDAESSISTWTFDSNVGWQNNSNNSAYLSWMWKRHAGFDVVTYVGNGTVDHEVPHNLAKIPEMMWVKDINRTGTDWMCYHKGLNGGILPYNRAILINHSDGEVNNYSHFGGAPTATNFTVGTSSSTNYNNDTIIAFLFASVAGISKVGSYDGSSSAQTITTGFAPKFLILKNITDNSTGWLVFDTERGWASGNDQMLNLNNSEVQWGGDDVGYPTSTGFYVNTANSQWNGANKKYIYYAHA